MSGKLKSVGELRQIRAAAQEQTANGGFHQRLFRSASSRPCAHADEARKTAATSDRRDQQRPIGESDKGPHRPMIPETDRVELIAAMEMVDYVILFDETDPYKLIAAIKPNVLAKGGDWSTGQDYRRRYR